MKHTHNSGMVFCLIAVAAFIFTESLRAQDPTKVASKHYKVVFENDSVRVLRITYAPHEKSVMHEHPNAVAVFLTDLNVHFTLPDGKIIDNTGKAGDAIWTPAGKHLPENLADKALEAILVELKPHKAKTK